MSMPSLMEIIAARKAASNRVRTLKPNPGRNRYRILPGWRKNGDETFFHDFGQHWIKDGAGQNKAVYVCVDKTFGRPCEICDALSHAISSTYDDTQKKLLESARASGRVLLNVLHIDGPTPNEPQILEIAPSVFAGKKGVGGIVSLFEDYPDLIHPTKGRDIIVEKAGSGLDTAYAVKMVPTDCPPVPASVLARLPDIDAFVRQESADGARRALGAVASVSGIALSASYAPAPALAAPAPAAGSAPAPFVPAAYDPDEDAIAKMTAPRESAPVAPAPVAAAAAAPVAAPPAAETVSTGDPDLDALLKDLG